MKKKLFFLLVLLILAGRTEAFELAARIYPVNIKIALRFQAKSQWAKDNISQIKVGYIRDDRRFANSDAMEISPNRDYIPFTVENDEIVVDITLRGEHEHTFVFEMPKLPDQKYPATRHVSVLTLDEKTFQLRPFKGNVHQHSKVSDGKWEPEDHIRYARAAGFDFVSVTDHSRFEQNPRAIATARDSLSGLEVYAGEEIHTHRAVLHAVGVGGKRNYSEGRTPELKKAIEPILAGLIEEFPQVHKTELTCIAEAIILCRRAREEGALVIYAHPYWWTQHRFNASPFFTEYMLRHSEVDAIEIINDDLASRKNPLIMSQLYELAAETGRKWPVISSSDSHDVAGAMYKRNYNVIFAGDCTYPSFKDAVTSFRSVAGYLTHSIRHPNTPVSVYFGPSKFVRYAYFLEEHGYWKEHDRLAAQQAELLAKYIAGDKTVVPGIEKLANAINTYRENYYHHTK